jgi:hypothetical protein
MPVVCAVEEQRQRQQHPPQARAKLETKTKTLKTTSSYTDILTDRPRIILKKPLPLRFLSIVGIASPYEK